LEKVRPDGPPAVAALVRRLMAKDPADRYQTPAELVRDLEPRVAERPQGVLAAPPPDRPEWISPSAQPSPGQPPLPGEPTPTRMLDRVEVFAPSPRLVEASGPNLLEPLWKYAPSDARPRQTHDTLSLAPALDTADVTAEGMTLEKDPPSAGKTPTPAADFDTTINPALRRLWRRWTALVEIIIVGHGPSRVNADDYRSVHASLLHACRQAVESAGIAGPRAFYQEMLSIVQPWFHLQTFRHTEPDILASLLERCKQIELELNGGKVPWTVRQFIGLVLMMLSLIGLALWYWNAGRFGLPSLLRSLRADFSSLSLRSVGSYLPAHLSLLAVLASLLAILLSVYLLSRRPRA
jgi:hypothetical protein